MKKIKLYILTLVGLLMFNSCSDELMTEPTDKVSGPTMLKDATTAQTAINGLYRLMYSSGWTSSNGTQTAGQISVSIMADAMGEDFVINEQGSGWYSFDYKLDHHRYYASKSMHPYGMWNYYFTLISNANYILAAEGKLDGDPDMAKSIMGQAYAMRAFSYHYLVQLYQQTYVGHEDAPGIPLYTEPTVAGSIGKGRGTVKEVYAQINKDIDKSIALLGSIDKTQTHCSHIDYYVANGLKARFCLVQHKYEDAAAAASLALSRPDRRVASIAELGGNNNVSAPDVLWGIQILKDQSQGYSSLFSHLDADASGLYASTSRKCISTGLYNLISNTDARRSSWFRGALPSNQVQTSGSMVSYCQLKFKFVDYSVRTGDYLFMRMEEMLLIKAESECQLNKYTEARATLSALGNKRDSDFANRLAARTDASTYNSDTNAPLVTLMDEILFQRRVELWGEFGRIFDLQRLGLGYNRVYVGSNHAETLSTKNTGVASPLFIMPIPQSEFDGNESLSSPKDQNPILN